MTTLGNNTFFYFFSTVAQCLAAITALALVAAQMRIAFLDEVVTAAKRAVISTWQGPIHVGPIEHEMSANSASEILKIARAKNITAANFKSICDALEKAILNAQVNRTNSARLICWLVISTLIPILELPLSEWLCQKELEYQIALLAVNYIGLAIIGFYIIRTVNQVLGIRLRRQL